MVLPVVLSVLLAAASAAPSRPIVVADLPAAPVVAAPVAVVSSQSHAQDELGQYSYSYSNPLSAKVETKTVDGVTRGGYSYLDSHGIVQNVNYVSDDVNGFRVAASNLPLGPVSPQQDEPLVAHEKSKTVAALHDAAVKDGALQVIHENEVDAVAQAVHHEAPVVHHHAPVVHYEAPSVHHEAPTVHYEAPVAHHEVPAVHYEAPPVHHEDPLLLHAPTVPVHSTVSPAPLLVSTPAPTTYVSSTPEAPVVHVTPAPYRSSTPDYQPSPAPVAHSYATVELDSYDIPAPAPAPGAYFRPSPAVITHDAVSSPETKVYEESPVVFNVAPASPTVVHVTPAPEVLAEVVHAPSAPAVHAAPLAVVPTHVAAAPVVAAPVAVVSSQSHAQDELGQYSYSYSNPLSAKVETKTVDGVTRGGYSYLDSHGIVQNVNYVSDDVNGFRVAASNLPTGTMPVAVPDSDDVAAAKQLFLADHAL